MPGCFASGNRACDSSLVAATQTEAGAAGRAASLFEASRALSLAVAQRCNLGCTYCYAQQGSFGDVPKSMPLATALKAVDLLFAETNPGERVNLAFLGGEPLINRRVIRAATEHAQRRADESRTT